MASSKDTFESKTFASNTFACGTFRGTGVASVPPGKGNINFIIDDNRKHFVIDDNRKHFVTEGPK